MQCWGWDGFKNKVEATGHYVLSGLTCGRAGGGEDGTGALDISGAAGLSLVEGPFQLAVVSDSGCTPDECSGRSALWGSKIDNRESTMLTGRKKERKKCFLLSIFGIPSFPRNKLPCVQSSSIKRGKNTSNHWHYFFKHIQCRERISCFQNRSQDKNNI